MLQAIRRGAVMAARASVVPASCARPAAVRSLHTAAPMWMSSGGVVTADDIEHATGLELAELEKAVKGEDLFTDSDAVWLNSPMGTLTNPVVVTSVATERIVGAVDPDDDSIVCWGIVKVGAPPKLIGDEYFVLKQIEGGGSH